MLQESRRSKLPPWVLLVIALMVATIGTLALLQAGVAPVVPARMTPAFIPSVNDSQQQTAPDLAERQLGNLPIKANSKRTLTCRVADGAKLPSVLLPEDIAVRAGDLMVSFYLELARDARELSLHFDEWPPGADTPGSVLIPGFLETSFVMHHEVAYATLVGSGEVNVLLQGLPAGFLESVVPVATAWPLHPGLQAGPLEFPDGSRTSLPSPASEIATDQFGIPGLPVGVPYLLQIRVNGGPDISQAVQVAAPQSVVLDLDIQDFIPVVCSQPVDGTLRMHDSHGRFLATTALVGGRGFLHHAVTVPEVYYSSWGEGWVGSASFVIEGPVGPRVLVQVRPRSTYALVLPDVGEVMAWEIRSGRMRMLNSVQQATEPVADQRGKRLLIVAQAGTRLLLHSNLTNSFQFVVLPDSPQVIDVDFPVVEGLIVDGIPAYDRLRRVYRGTREATCGIAASLLDENGMELLVTLETLYFFDGGLGGLAKAENWQFPRLPNGRYCAVVEAEGGRRLDRIDLNWVPLAR